MGQSCIPGPFALGERTSPALPRLLVLTICLNVTMHQSGRSLSGGSSVRLSLETGLSVTLLPADCQLHFGAPGLSVTLWCFWTVSYTLVLLDCQLHFLSVPFFSQIFDFDPGIEPMSFWPRVDKYRTSGRCRCWHILLLAALLLGRSATTRALLSFYCRSGAALV